MGRNGKFGVHISRLTPKRAIANALTAGETGFVRQTFGVMLFRRWP
jgi:hypothetical protein